MIFLEKTISKDCIRAKPHSLASLRQEGLDSVNHRKDQALPANSSFLFCLLSCVLVLAAYRRFTRKKMPRA